MIDQMQCDDYESTPPAFYLRGLSLWTVGFGLFLGLFLPCLEVSIVSTSLVTITNDLHGFDQGSWVITSYLLTYTGFLMIWSKCGDIFGVKHSLLCSLVVFIVFSGACGAAQGLNQLIVFRALQGIGSAGVYTLTLFSLLRLVPRHQYDLITAMTAAVMTSGLVLGPLAGGAIDTSGAWRWIFLLNLPAGAFSWILLFVAMPRHYPHPPPSIPTSKFATSRLLSTFNDFMTNQRAFFGRVDFLGAFLVLAASVFVITALQEGNLQYQWSSGLIVSFLVISGIFWVAFLVWEWAVSRSDWKLEPMLPWRLTQNRIFMGVALGFFLTGAPLTICVIEIPQRFQTVNGSSPIGAGVKLLAYALSNPVGGFICSGAAGRLRVPFVYILLAGIALQIVGVFLLSEIPDSIELWTGQFGYTVLAGLGVGMAGAAFYMMVPLVVEEYDQSIALGTGLQLRMFGGALGIAIVTTIMNSYLKSHLPALLSPEQLSAVLDSAQVVATFPSELQVQVRQAYARAYNMQMKATWAFSIAQLLPVLLLWKKQQVRFLRHDQYEEL